MGRVRGFYRDYYDDDDDDYNYNHSYNKKSHNTEKENKYYNTGYNWKTSWQESSFYTSYWNTKVEEKLVDENMLFMNEHESYKTPAISEFEHWFWHNDEAIQLATDLSRFFFYKMIDDKNYLKPKYKNVAGLTQEEFEQVEKRKPVYEKLWETPIPGFTAKEKAIYVVSNMNNFGIGSGKIEELKEEMIEKMKISNDIMFDAEYNKICDELDIKGYAKIDLLNKISLIKNFGSKFKVEKEIEQKIVANSRLHTNKKMTDFSQVYNVEIYQRLLPNYAAKLATKDLLTAVPIEKTEHKQKIIMIVDYSGSMNEVFKQTWVKAILFERLALVMKEECEIFFSYFLYGGSELHFTHLYNRETALYFIKNFMSTRPNGGGTDLGAVTEIIANEILLHKKLRNLNVDLSKENIELLAINDGQDSPGANEFKWKTNVIALHQFNNLVKERCLENEGAYVHIDAGSKITIYE